MATRRANRQRRRAAAAAVEPRDIVIEEPEVVASQASEGAINASFDKNKQHLPFRLCDQALNSSQSVSNIRKSWTAGNKDVLAGNSMSSLVHAICNGRLSNDKDSSTLFGAHYLDTFRTSALNKKHLHLLRANLHLLAISGYIPFDLVIGCLSQFQEASVDNKLKWDKEARGFVSVGGGRSLNTIVGECLLTGRGYLLSLCDGPGDNNLLQKLIGLLQEVKDNGALLKPQASNYDEIKRLLAKMHGKKKDKLPRRP